MGRGVEPQRLRLGSHLFARHPEERCMTSRMGNLGYTSSLRVDIFLAYRGLGWNI